MTVQSWVLYLTLVLAATATPGPAVLFIMTNSTLYGWRKASFAAFGNIVGLFCLGIIAVTGLGAILKTSVLLYDLVKFAGAAYLVYLGLKMIFQKNLDVAVVNDRMRSNEISAQKLFFRALGVALSNPKAILFLTALFPQFIHTDQTIIPQFSTLIGLLMFFSCFFLMFYSLIAHKAKTWLSRPGRIRIFNRTSGTVFIGFGLLLATSSNK